MIAFRKPLSCALLIAMGLAAVLNPATTLATDIAARPARLVAMTGDGRSISLADARGRRSLVIFWSPQSLASRKSLPELQRFAAAPENRDIFLLAVSTSLDRPAVEAFVAQRKLGFPYAFRGEDELGAIDEERLPLVLVFDAEGRLLRQRDGMFHQKLLRRLIDGETTSGLRRPASESTISQERSP